MENILRYLQKEMNGEITENQMNHWVEKTCYIFGAKKKEVWEAIQILIRYHDIKELPQKCKCLNLSCNNRQDADSQRPYPIKCPACGKTTLEMDKDVPHYEVNITIGPTAYVKEQELQKPKRERVREAIDAWLLAVGKGGSVNVTEDEFEKITANLALKCNASSQSANFL
jgi:hypothetical protein